MTETGVLVNNPGTPCAKSDTPHTDGEGRGATYDAAGEALEVAYQGTLDVNVQELLERIYV